MSVEHIGKGYVKICVSEEELENSIAGLSQLKPILQTQVMKGNGRNTKQGLIDAAELGKHFDTAIDAMTMLLAGFKEESEGYCILGIRVTDYTGKVSETDTESGAVNV